MKLFKNFLCLSGAEVFGKLLTFAAFAYLARVLGAETFGYIEFAGAALMCASLFVDQGFSALGAREIAKSPARTPRLTGEIVAARFLLACFSYLVIVLLALTIDLAPVVSRLLLIYGLSLWALPLLLQWVFQGYDRMGLVAVAQIIRQAVFAVVVFIFVAGPAEILMVAWAEVAAVTTAAVFCLVMYRLHFSSLARTKFGISASVFREGVPIGLSHMFWVIRMCGGTLILGLIASAREVAFFAGAQRVLLALHTFVWLYFFNLLPSMSRAWQTGSNEFTHLIRTSLKTVAWLGIAVTVVWVAVGQQAMKFIYGSDFKEAGKVLSLFGFVWLGALIDGHYRFALIAAGRQNTEMFTSALGVATAVILIPLSYLRFGLIGAAAALVIAEAVVWISSRWLTRDLISVGNQHKEACEISVLKEI